MKFECGDLDRALRNPDLMMEAREHLKSCANCRCEHQLWSDISIAAKELHCEWETPALWGNIEASIAAEKRPRRKWWLNKNVMALAACVAIVSAVLLVRFRTSVMQPGKTQAIATAAIAANEDFLTDQALREVEKSEEAYVRSIQKLSRLAQSRLEHPPSALHAAYREKLTVLDGAIAETRANLAHNRFNVRLQTELAGLYSEKQQTLREILTGDSANNN